MALTGSSFPNGGNVGGFPQPGGGVRETPQERKDRIASEDRAQEVLNDPYGLRTGNQAGQTNGTTRTVLKKVKVRRNNGETQNTENSGNTNGTGGTGRTGRNGPAGQASGYHMLQRSTMGQSNLVRASALFQSSQAQNPSSSFNNAALSVRTKMLLGLNGYIQNDYAMMKLNPDDKAFTYRTAEARQLNATIGQMVASTTRTGNNAPKTNEEMTSPRLSPEAFGRQKGLLRRLAAMSETNPKLPDNLPTDYKPFHSVA